MGLLHNVANEVISSYATGAVNGGGGTDLAGGLAGDWGGATVIANYATGAVDGGAGTSDRVGSLIGRGAPKNAASYGFGSTSNGTKNNIGTTLPDSVTAASGLTSSNAGDLWDSDAWDFGTTSQAPALKYLYKLWNRLASGSYFPPAVKRFPYRKRVVGTRTRGSNGRGPSGADSSQTVP